MTSVEWLIEQLQAPCRGIPTHIIDKANEMHEQEVIDAYHINPLETKWGNEGILYYQETFKNK